MTEEYIYTYQTINEVNGKSYVGVHKTNNINDGYIGCGVFSQNNAIRPTLLFHKAVRKYGYNSFRKYILSFFDSYEDALDEEKYIVTKEWVNSENNYNTAIGGRGNTSMWMDDNEKNIWRLNISEGVKKWMNNGGYEKVKKSSPQNLVKKYGGDNNLFGKPNKRRKKILQLNINGGVVKIHDSINHAGRGIKTTPGNITSCCKGRYKSCKGFVFRYETYSESEAAELNLTLNLKKRGRDIFVFNKNGDFVSEFRSLKEAVYYIGCSKSLADRCLCGKIKYCKGYILKYK